MKVQWRSKAKGDVWTDWEQPDGPEMSALGPAAEAAFSTVYPKVSRVAFKSAYGGTVYEYRRVE